MAKHIRPSKRSVLFPLSFIVLVLIGIVRIAATYSVFNHTWDEPPHIAAGLEWLDLGTYIYEPQHPPLVRIAIALGPFLSGSRISKGQREFLHHAAEEIIDRPRHWRKRYISAAGAEGKRILYESGSYWRTLALARIGVLPFFCLAALIVAVWSSCLFGRAAGLIAVAFFTTLPPTLAHAGLATLDMGITATLMLFFYFLHMWLEHPTAARSLLLGCGFAVAILSKLTAILFIPVCIFSLFIWRLVTGRHTTFTSLLSRRYQLKFLGLAVATAFVVIWAGYGFSLSPLTSVEARPHKMIDRLTGAEGMLHDVAYAVAELPLLPASELLAGIAQAEAHNERGHKAYFLGKTSKKGWWFFFPVALAVKTPLPFLLLTLIGIIFLSSQAWRTKEWYVLEPVVYAISIIAACMLVAHINIGIRHVLIVYPLFAIIVGAGVVALWNSQKFKGLYRFLAIILVIWQLVSSAGAHPDYIAYFNETAGQHPEKILVDSDLDWGQDLARLSCKLKALGVKHVSIAYYGYADLDKHGLPDFKYLLPNKKTTGWIAISISTIKKDVGFAWLEAFTPVAKAGKSIWIYNIVDRFVSE